MKVLAVYNIKGGVGKTAAAVNLAYLAQRAGQPTLIWDLDPQGAASFYFRVNAKLKGSGKKLIKGKQDLEEQIKGTNYAGLDLVPADFSLRHFDLALDTAKHPEERLRKLLKPLKEHYRLVVLDCPPSISLLSESIFNVADVLLSPVIPTPLSLRTREQLREALTGLSIPEERLWSFFSMVDRRKALHRQILEDPAKLGGIFLDTYVPYSSVVERMGTERRPLPAFAANSEAGRAYRTLWQELAARLFA